MTSRARRIAFLVAASVLGAFLVWGLSGLPRFGGGGGPYGALLNRVAVPERHATNVVAAVTFDYRGFDTLGEEFILFAAVIGVAILLRAMRGEAERLPEEAARGRRVPGTSNAVPGADPGDARRRRAAMRLLDFLPYLVAAWLFLIGLYGIVTSRNLIHAVTCLAVVQSSTYVLLLAIGYRRGATAPIFFDVPQGTRAVDPVVGALTLTDIVVGATVTALLLALVVQVHKRFGTLDPDELHRLEG